MRPPLADAEARIGAVFPPAYADVVDRLRVNEVAITHAQIKRFLHIDEPMFRRARSAAAGGERQSEAEESINLMVRVLAATETDWSGEVSGFVAVATVLIRASLSMNATVFESTKR